MASGSVSRDQCHQVLVAISCPRRSCLMNSVATDGGPVNGKQACSSQVYSDLPDWLAWLTRHTRGFTMQSQSMGDWSRVHKDRTRLFCLSL